MDVEEKISRLLSSAESSVGAHVMTVDLIKKLLHRVNALEAELVRTQFDVTRIDTTLENHIEYHDEEENSCK